MIWPVTALVHVDDFRSLPLQEADMASADGDVDSPPIFR